MLSSLSFGLLLLAATIMGRYESAYPKIFYVWEKQRCDDTYTRVVELASRNGHKIDDILSICLTCSHPFVNQMSACLRNETATPVDTALAPRDWKITDAKKVTDCEECSIFGKLLHSHQHTYCFPWSLFSINAFPSWCVASDCASKEKFIENNNKMKFTNDNSSSEASRC